jgi:uncharacterized protein GlcG (DUF336 family)
MKNLILCAAALAVTTPAFAQAVRPPASEAHGPTQLQVFMPPPDAVEIKTPRPHRMMSIPSALAVKAAQTAVDSCKAQGVDVAAVVIDSQGIPIAMIAADDTPAMVERIIMGKAYGALKADMPSGDAGKKAKTDPAFAARFASDPMVGPFRQGGLPIHVGSRLVGAIGVSGGKTSEQEEGCSQAGIAAIQASLK